MKIPNYMYGYATSDELAGIQKSCKALAIEAAGYAEAGQPEVARALCETVKSLKHVLNGCTFDQAFYWPVRTSRPHSDKGGHVAPPGTEDSSLQRPQSENVVASAQLSE